VRRGKIWLHVGILTRISMMVVLRKHQTKASMCYSFADFRDDFSQDLFYHRLVCPALSLFGCSWLAPVAAKTPVT